MSLQKPITNGQLKKQELDLCNRFVMQKDHQSLTNLLVFTRDYDLPFPIHNSKVRETLFNLSSWQIEEKYQEDLFDIIKEFLFSNVTHSQKNEWHSWLRESRNLTHHINVLTLSTSQALSEAHKAGKFNDLPKIEHNYLLGLYLQAYGEILENTGPEDQQDLLPVLVEFATITQVLGPNEYSARILNNWARRRPLQPRALTGMSDEQVKFAPIRGVGSPHGVSVTIYQDPGSNAPTRITRAGVTGDATLNSQVFTSLFAAALACNSEPTFVTSSGGILSLEEQERDYSSRPITKLVSAAIGPNGPVEPRSGTPTLGMSPEEAMTLVLDLFNRFQETTGLVHVTRWQTEDAIELENELTQALSVKDDRPIVITSDFRYSEGAGVIHLMPLYHRGATGEVKPVEIEIPYQLLGSERVFTLLREARNRYMKQLISAGQQRREHARQAFDAQDKQVIYWASLSEKQKQARCQQDPWVTITQSYDFELGITTPLASPQKVDRREYEDSQRPQIRDHAKEYAEKFTALCKKLEDLNQPGGKADILTFKLLVDSMIRHSSLSISPDFQHDYRDWVKRSSFLVWAAIEGWARGRGFSPETLAADNILFNAQLKVTSSQKSVVIQPWIMVDLHDFVIQVDRQNGVMKVFPSGKTPSLVDVFIPDLENGITDPNSLHKLFCSWTTNNFLREERTGEEEAVRSEIFNDPQISGMLTLTEAKQLLFKGKTPQATEIIRMIRKFDLAPIYFWGAVSHQYQFLERNQIQFGLRLNQYSQSEKAERLLNAAFGTLVESLKQLEDKQSQTTSLSRIFRKTTPQPALVPVDNEAQKFLQQLRSRDPSFIQGLLEQKPIFELENDSLNWSETDKKRFSGAIYALSSLEFLHLAETMKNMASSLPFTGTGTRDLRQNLDQILKQAQSLTFQDSSVTPQIERLANRF
jgi:hypothetical protein